MRIRWDQLRQISHASLQLPMGIVRLPVDLVPFRLRVHFHRYPPRLRLPANMLPQVTTDLQHEPRTLLVLEEALPTRVPRPPDGPTARARNRFSHLPIPHRVHPSVRHATHRQLEVPLPIAVLVRGAMSIYVSPMVSYQHRV